MSKLKHTHMQVFLKNVMSASNHIGKINKYIKSKKWKQYIY